MLLCDEISSLPFPCDRGKFLSRAPIPFIRFVVKFCAYFFFLVLCPSFSLLCSFPYALCFAFKRCSHHAAICEIIFCNFMAPPNKSPKAYTKRVVVQHRPFNNIPCRYVLKRRILCFKTVSSLLLL